MPIEKGGMAIRNMGVVAFTASARSLAASLKHAATIFPEWVKLGQKGELLQVSHDASPEMSVQVLRYVGEYQRRVPQGIFKENDDFSAIIKTITDLESGDGANSRPVRLQRSSQGPLNESEVLHQPSRRRTPQSVLYSDFVKEELQRLLRRRDITS